MHVVLAGLVLLLCLGCGGADRDGEQFRIYHLETAIGGPDEDGELRCGSPRPVCPGVVRQPPRRDYRYSVRAAAAVTSEDIVRSTVRRGTGEIVLVELTAEGSAAFARLTKEVARTGGRDQGWHHVAIVVGDEIVAFPEIDYDQYPDGLTDAPAIQIVAASDADAEELVRRLRGGSSASSRSRSRRRACRARLQRRPPRR